MVRFPARAEITAADNLKPGLQLDMERMNSAGLNFSAWIQRVEENKGETEQKRFELRSISNRRGATCF